MQLFRLHLHCSHTDEEEEYVDTENLKSRVDEFSHVDMKVCMTPVGIGIAREGAASNIGCIILARQVAFREFGYILSVDHVRLHLHRLSTDGLIHP